MIAFGKAWGVVKDDDDEPGRWDALRDGDQPTPYNHLDRREDGLYIGGNKVLKGWESYSGWYWFATELDAGEPGRHFGYVQGMHSELGYFSMREMQPLIDEGMIWELPQSALSYSGRQCECELCG